LGAVITTARKRDVTGTATKTSSLEFKTTITGLIFDPSD
jgi:hypothetical protein